MNKLSADRRCFVLSMYHFNARTGHMRRSSGTEEIEEIDGRKICPGVKDIVWFLAMNCGFGKRWTPDESNLM